MCNLLMYPFSMFKYILEIVAQYGYAALTNHLFSTYA